MSVFTGQRAIIGAVLAATARITPGRLRGAEVDHMDEIIRAVADGRKTVADLH